MKKYTKKKCDASNISFNKRKRFKKNVRKCKKKLKGIKNDS